MAINLFNRVNVDFGSLADHDKTVFCLLAREAGADRHAIAWAVYVEPDVIRLAQEAKHFYQVKSVGFGDNDHV